MHEGPVVVVSGGGTGGHLYPALAIADALRERRPDVRVVFVGAERGLESRLLPERGEEHVLLPVLGFDRSRRLGNWRAALGLVRGLALARRALRGLRPEVVVVTGGYAGAAAGIVAASMHIPLVLQEQNSFPGRVTRLLARWATRVHVAYPEVTRHLRVPEERVRVSGNPVRPRAEAGKSVARRGFGVPDDARLVLVVGGSQGSLVLNQVMLGLSGELMEERLQVPEGVHFLWATGPKHFDGVRAALPRAPANVHVVPYLEDMPAALAAADVAVSRAGAMVTAELIDRGLPSVLVPLPTAAEDHQTHNARALTAAGAAELLPQAELTPRSLAARLTALLQDPAALERMRRNALERARPDARLDIAADVASLLSPPEAHR